MPEKFGSQPWGRSILSDTDEAPWESVSDVLFVIDPSIYCYESDGTTCEDTDAIDSIACRVYPSSNNWSSQSTAAFRPTYVATNAAAGNRPTMNFDGGTEKLYHTTQSIADSCEDGLTWFYVANADNGQSLTATTVGGSIDSDANDNCYFYGYLLIGGHLSNGIYINDVNRRITRSIKLVNDETPFFISACRIDSAGYVTLYHNGAPEDSMVISGASWTVIEQPAKTTMFGLGSRYINGSLATGNEWDGDIAMILCWHEPIPYTDMQTVHDWLSAYFSITLAFEYEGETIYTVSLPKPNYTEYPSDETPVPNEGFTGFLTYETY